MNKISERKEVARGPSKSIELTDAIAKWLRSRRYGEMKALAVSLFEMAIELHELIGERAVFAIINKEIKFVPRDIKPE